MFGAASATARDHELLFAPPGNHAPDPFGDPARAGRIMCFPNRLRNSSIARDAPMRHTSRCGVPPDRGRSTKGAVVTGIGTLIVALMAFVALRRTKALAARVEALEYRLALQRVAQPTDTRDPEPTRPTPAPSATASAPPPVVAPPPRSTPAPPPTRPVAVSPSTHHLPDLSAIDWERWLGVRGAAVLGGAVLALAGLFFFRYSIEHELIPPWLRIVIGGAVGIACLAGSERFVRARHAGLADALAGAGMVILYGAFWAARSLYALIGPATAFAGMIATTVAGTALAWRHASLVIALFGLAGGFATPLLLASRIENPIGLFAYLLLLDLGVLLLAMRRGWPQLAVASLVATLGYQVLFVGWQMGTDQVGLALAIVAVFGLAFAASGRFAPDDARGEYRVAQAGGALFPFAFAFYFAANARLDVGLVSVALLLVPLVLAATWVAQEQRRSWIAIGAAAAGVAVVAAWVFLRPVDSRVAWETVAVATALAGAQHLFLERRPGAAATASLAALLAAAGHGLVLLMAPQQHPAVPLWPWLAGWLALAALLLRHATRIQSGPLMPATALGVAVGLGQFANLRARDGETAAIGATIAAAIAVAIVAQGVAMRMARSPLRNWAEHAAGVVALIFALFLSTPPVTSGLAAWIPLGASIGLGVLAAIVATRQAHGAWLLAAMGVTAAVHMHWAFGPAASASIASPLPLLLLSRRRRDLQRLAARGSAPGARSLGALRVGARGAGLLRVAPDALRSALRRHRARCRARRARRRLADRSAPLRARARRGRTCAPLCARLADRCRDRLRDRRGSAPTRTRVDHDRLGTRSTRARVALGSLRPSRSQVDGVGALRRGHGATRREPRAARLPPVRRSAGTELAALHVPRSGRRTARRRDAPGRDRGSRARATSSARSTRARCRSQRSWRASAVCS